MEKGYRSRKEKTRKQRKRVYIVCEGKETGINYLNGFKERNSGVEIIPVHGKCTDPRGIVTFAEERMDCKWCIDFDEGDGVWCVFDVDENPSSVIKDMSEHASTKNIRIALSNPSFELWFLLHFKDVFSHITRQEAKSNLKKFIKDYEKNNEVNNILSPNLAYAIKRAEKLNQSHESKNTPLLSAESNPSSQVFKLVNFIKDRIKKNKVD